MAEPTAPKGTPPPRHFGHGPLAQRLANEVFDSLLPAGERRSELHPKTTGRLGPALVVGVFGEWGAGKSYLLSEVGDEIKQLREQRTQALVQQHPPSTEAGEPPTEITVLVEFNAWRFEREPHLLIPMLKVAEQAMRDEVERAVPPGTKRREWLADHVALLGALIEGIYANGGRQALQMWLDAQGAALKLPEPAKDDKPPKPSILERLGLKKKALAAPRKVSTPIPALESLYFNFFEYLRGITGRNPSFLKNVQQRLTQGGLAPGIEALHRLEQAGRWLTTGQMREPARLHVNLVFLVDDLDRCLPEKAIEVLEAVKLFLDVEGCAFVLALDEEVVERGIAHRYQAYTSAAQGQTPITGAEYLEKLIHLPIRLPRPGGEDAQFYLAAHWPELYAQAASAAPADDPRSQPNELAELVATLTPPVPRKLQRITSLMQLNQSLAGQLEAAGGAAMPSLEQRRWLALMCALQLFAPALFRYLRVQGAWLLQELVQWRQTLRLGDLKKLSEDLRQETQAVKQPYELRNAYARERLPELLQGSLSSRSGFSLLTWLEQVQDQSSRAEADPKTLQRLLALAVAEPQRVVLPSAPPASVAPVPASPVATEQEQDEEEPFSDTSPAAGQASTEPASQSSTMPPASSTSAFAERARLDNEFALWEPLAAGDASAFANAVSREGAALAGRYLPERLVQRLVVEVQNRTDHWLKVEGEPRHPLVDLLNPLLTQDDVLQLGLPSVFGRPSWSRRTWQEGGSWSTELDWPSPTGEPVVLRSTGPRAKGVKLQGRRAWWAQEQRGELAGGEWAIGADGQWGLYLNLTIQGVTQRMRWMEPGTFLMGSPEGQGENNEHPQHPVTLTQGFWLADTPCTQALWQALMGLNTSGLMTILDADESPVENVTFDDVQAFHAKLSRALPTGWQADLPTEAEWEYACRAGSSTAYWWGDEPDGSQANWNKKLQGTTPITLYPANPWGLHDMHGNVWEWCADGRREYLGHAERNPLGDTDGDARVVRGGSWFSRPDDARSAFRSGGRRGDRNLDLGFRVALRSSSPGAEPGRTAEPA